MFVSPYAECIVLCVRKLSTMWVCVEAQQGAGGCGEDEKKREMMFDDGHVVMVGWFGKMGLEGHKARCKRPRNRVSPNTRPSRTPRNDSKSKPVVQ